MQVTRFDIDGPLLITQPIFVDERGSFTEAYNKRAFAEALPEIDFVQDNISRSHKAGTVRGLNFQCAPRAQAKLFRVLRGAVFDVCLDVRRGSPTFGKYTTTQLDAERGDAIFIPKGFAHGFCTMEDETAVQYKLDDYFSPKHCRTIRWSDPALAIAWPLPETGAVVLDRDNQAPLFADLDV